MLTFSFFFHTSTYSFFTNKTMAESLLLNLTQTVIEKLASLALQKIVLAWGLESELQQINKSLKAITAVLLDAEQHQSRSQRIQVWLEDLKDVLYDIEDAVDQCHCERLRRQVVKAAGNTTRKVKRFFSSSNSLAFRFKMARKLKNVGQRVAEIVKLKSDFGLTEGVNGTQVIRRERKLTHSFVDAATVIGRDEDKEKILVRLLNVSNGENVSILPIVGIGGMGKTTLAKLVYNDQRVNTHFQTKVWACISDDFDLEEVLRKIIEAASDRKCTGWGVEQLQAFLRKTINNKKYLLILDDVSNNNRRKWNELRALLMGGANGSKILVTTRENSVASVMANVPSYNLNDLSHKNCLSLFVKCAFKDEQDIMPVLRISYEQLPSHLKRCFAYCSFFPKYYIYSDFELIQFWMAHGLLQCTNENEELEDVGLRYFKELCSRSFFQDFDQLIGGVCCKMHGLMHDLALSLTQKECSIVISATQQIPRNVRHLIFANTNSLPESPL